MFGLIEFLICVRSKSLRSHNVRLRFLQVQSLQVIEASSVLEWTGRLRLFCQYIFVPLATLKTRQKFLVDFGSFFGAGNLKF